MAIVKVTVKIVTLVAAGLMLAACSSFCGSSCAMKCDSSPYCQPTYIKAAPERIK